MQLHRRWARTPAWERISEHYHSLWSVYVTACTHRYACCVLEKIFFRGRLNARTATAGYADTCQLLLCDGCWWRPGSVKIDKFGAYMCQHSGASLYRSKADQQKLSCYRNIQWTCHHMEQNWCAERVSFTLQTRTSRFHRPSPALTSKILLPCDQ